MEDAGLPIIGLPEVATLQAVGSTSLPIIDFEAAGSTISDEPVVSDTAIIHTEVTQALPELQGLEGHVRLPASGRHMDVQLPAIGGHIDVMDVQLPVGGRPRDMDVIGTRGPELPFLGDAAILCNEESSGLPDLQGLEGHVQPAVEEPMGALDPDLPILSEAAIVHTGALPNLIDLHGP